MYSDEKIHPVGYRQGLSFYFITDCEKSQEIRLKCQFFGRFLGGFVEERISLQG